MQPLRRITRKLPIAVIYEPTHNSRVSIWFSRTHSRHLSRIESGRSFYLAGSRRALSSGCAHRRCPSRSHRCQTKHPGSRTLPVLALVNLDTVWDFPDRFVWIWWTRTACGLSPCWFLNDHDTPAFGSDRFRTHCWTPSESKINACLLRQIQLTRRSQSITFPLTSLRVRRGQQRLVRLLVILIGQGQRKRWTNFQNLKFKTAPRND